MPPSKPFSQYTYDDAAEWFGVQIPRDGTRTFPDPLVKRRNQIAADATEFLKGNHWLDSRGFIGELPPTTVPFSAQITQKIKDAFVTENVIQEVVETHTGGLLGREPTWGFLNKEGKLAKGDNTFEAETGETLTPWWNERKALRDLQRAVQLLVCEGRVIRRLFFPRKLKGTTITATNLADALKFIYFTYHNAEVAGVFTDEDSQRDIGIFKYEEKARDGTVTANAAELSYLDDDGNTICRIVRDKGAPTEFPPYPLGGHLLLYELQRTPLITEQVQSNQRALNLAHTMMMRNVNMAGSRERVITNAKPPVSVVGRDVHSREQATVPGKWQTGPGAVMNVQGWPLYSDDGQNIVGYTNPNVTVTDPVSVETFERTIANEKQAIYSQCHQRHVLIVDKADTSGRAREVARREFERSLKETKVLVDASGRWQLETALRLAAYVIGSSRYVNLRADFNCLIDAGEPDPEKQKTVLLMRQPGGPKGRPLISDETAQAWIGVEDPAAEKTMIDNEASTKSAGDNPDLVGTPTPGQSIPGSKSTAEAVN